MLYILGVSLSESLQQSDYLTLNGLSMLPVSNTSIIDLIGSQIFQ
jgi:hypothetical protein